MDRNVLLMLKYGLFTDVIRLSDVCGFSRLVMHICGKWKNLKPCSLSFLYAIPGYSSCLLRDDSDMQSMVALVDALDLKMVDVSVVEGCVDQVGSCGSSLIVSDSRIVEYKSDSDVDTDLLPNFCMHDEKVLLSSNWVNCIREEGQVFRDVDVFRLELLKYSIEVGFDFTYIRNNRSKVVAKCKWSEKSGCQWFVHAAKEVCNDGFVIRKLVRVHTCGAAYRTGKSKRMSSALVAKEISGMVRADPVTRPVDIVRHFRQSYGLTISYDHAWKGVDLAKAEVYGDYKGSYDQLMWYLDTAMDANPGSRFWLEKNSSTDQFCRLFVSFGACIHGFKFCRPILFIDGTFLKSRYKGVLLTAIGKDANQGLYPVAYAVVDAETSENWLWFLHSLSSALDNDRVITFVSDRNNGILEALPRVFPNSPHGFCLQHLKNNLKDRYKGLHFNNGFRKRIAYKFRECAYAPTIQSFEQCLDALLLDGGDIAQEFVSTIPVENWANAYFIGDRYGEMSSNAAESFNNWIEKTRHLPITSMVDEIRRMIMNERAERLLACSKMNGVLCPAMDNRMQAMIEKGRSWQMSRSSEDVFEVRCDPSVVVDLEKRTCSCRNWELTSFPCVHASVVISRCNRDLKCFINRYYYVLNYSSCYAEAIKPIPTYGKPDFKKTVREVLPPRTRRPAGRQKKRRIRSKGELVRTITCGRCGKNGHHNRRSCKNPLQEV